MCKGKGRLWGEGGGGGGLYWPLPTVNFRAECVGVSKGTATKIPLTLHRQGLTLPHRGEFGTQ